MRFLSAACAAAALASGFSIAAYAQEENAATTDAAIPTFGALLWDKQWEAAVADAEARLAADPENIDAGADLAHVVLLSRQRDRCDEAIALLERAIEARPERAEYYFWIGQMYGEKARAAGLGGLSLAGKCKAAFSRAVELEPSNFEYVYALNEFLIEAPFIAGGSAGRARKAARQFAKIDSDAAMMLSARILIVDGKYEKALELLRPIERRGVALYDATRRMLLSQAAIGLIDDGRAAEVLPVLVKLIEEFPNNALVNLALGRARFETGNVEGAIESLNHSLENSRTLDTLYHLALAQKAAGNRDAARALFTEAGAAAKGSMADDIECQLADIGG
ncbi:MAG: tetratricopeptide repeat protein [Opitutaceae bacterium]